MNTFKSAMIGAVVGAIVTLLLTNIGQNKAQAQAGAAAETYYCLPLPDTIKSGDFKAKLDALGEQGWKVRCSIGATLILAR
jgi:hypothetical protein